MYNNTWILYTKSISSAIYSLLHKVQGLLLRGMPICLPVSTKSRWFDVQNLTNNFRRFNCKIFKYFSYPKVTFRRIYKIGWSFLHKLVFKSLLDSISNQFMIYNELFISNVRKSTVFKKKMQNINGFLKYLDIKIFL